MMDNKIPVLVHRWRSEGPWAAGPLSKPCKAPLRAGTGNAASRLVLMPDTIPTLALPLDYLARLIVTTRGVQAKEGEVDPASGSNPTDDKMWDVLQDSGDDLSRQEIREQIQGLSEREQAELVALMWIGRGDAEPEEWESTVELARELKDGPTPRYLLRHPLVAEHWEEGADRLGLDLPIGESL
jgi:Protein of unknown function (DUF3775)